MNVNNDVAFGSGLPMCFNFYANGALYYSTHCAKNMNFDRNIQMISITK